MMVEDETGSRALLGRPKKLRTGVLTCLSGFVEQVSPCHNHPVLGAGDSANLKQQCAFSVQCLQIVYMTKLNRVVKAGP